MRKLFYLLILGLWACSEKQETKIATWVPYDETAIIAKNADHESQQMRYKLIQSKVSDRNDLWKQIEPQISDFGDEDYKRLTPVILEQDMLSIQNAVSEGKLSYKELAQWYLYRIVLFENDSLRTLNNIISINPKVVEEAISKDEKRSDEDHPIFGMPILLKDNINFEGIPTTAGAVALRNNYTDDAHIVSRLENSGAIILGKSSLSEWANFLCDGCPNGYNAIGGQTLNPYGRGEFDTGGSSSGSGSSIAANYAAGAIGTETSGSILSPSSSNSIVGLKPTVGLLSRGGIVPISSTLDTPGPMTRNVMDNAILLSALVGEDAEDQVTVGNSPNKDYWKSFGKSDLKGMRLGVMKDFLQDSLYKSNIKQLEELGAELVEVEAPEVNLSGFLTLLNLDMKADLLHYFEKYSGPSIEYQSVKDIIDFNLEDTATRIPYGQARFEGIVNDSTSVQEFDSLKIRLMSEGRKYFETMINENNLDAILSINNWSAGYAAVAHHPALTVPMGYEKSGQPKGITFIAEPFSEEKLLKLAYTFEKKTKAREIPADYR
ncbi:amidase family protein [Marivirga harenae]|uniref:amidase family protein n=1 Tax=Marivirga harenae TaxID=2010992 RepID=UPI0026E04331|nr:amidase family protein [Marivirga harenae]WKV11060.1 amidase family protein [Marivirga harenae]|tara:strand:+ start:151183 stop:152826 length:1644 start_codon:yes stop_codon:yes gene_type:complete